MKPTSDAPARPAPPTIERRSFIWKAGAALSAGLASAAATAAPSERVTEGTQNLQEQLERVSSQLGMLEDTNAIRKLHHSFGDFINKRLYAEIVELFADDSEVHFDGGVFVGKDAGVRRLYVERFAAAKDGPVHAFLLDQTPQQDLVEVAPDRQSATARFHRLVQAEAAVSPTLPIVEMARQQGQGFLQWWERGVYENSYVKDGGVWKIRQLRYRTTGEADPALARARSRPVDIPSSA